MNWTNYKNYWDQYYSDWYNTGVNAQNDPFFGGKSTLCNYETPEPYYFGGNLPSEGDATFPNNSIEAVILNINPGVAHPNEWVKFWQNRNKPNAFIIYNSHKYTFLNNNYNPLTTSGVPPMLIPGFTWWSNNRFPWLNRFIGRTANQSQVFAIEPCPWHSTNANSIDYGFLIKSPVYLKYFQDLVIDPAADAIRASRLRGGLTNKPFGIWFGDNMLRKLLVKNFNFKVLYRWDQSSGLPGWPKNGNGMPVKRTYELYEGTDSYGRDCRFLFLTYPNVGVYAPSVGFSNVDQIIKKKI